MAEAPANSTTFDSRGNLGEGGTVANGAPEIPAAPLRRSLLELAPLELDCMSTLWPLGEGTVRQIRDGLAARRPRAYTTIMTIMDRLERKGIVERRKAGRRYVYRPALTAEQARSHALKQMVESFFGGSPEAMLAEMNRRWGGPSAAPEDGAEVHTGNGAKAAGSEAVPSEAVPSHVSR